MNKKVIFVIFIIVAIIILLGLWGYINKRKHKTSIATFEGTLYTESGKIFDVTTKKFTDMSKKDVYFKPQYLTVSIEFQSIVKFSFDNEMIFDNVNIKTSGETKMMSFNNLSISQYGKIEKSPMKSSVINLILVGKKESSLLYYHPVIIQSTIQHKNAAVDNDSNLVKLIPHSVLAQQCFFCLIPSQTNGDSRMRKISKDESFVVKSIFKGEYLTGNTGYPFNAYTISSDSTSFIYDDMKKTIQFAQSPTWFLSVWGGEVYMRTSDQKGSEQPKEIWKIINIY